MGEMGHALKGWVPPEETVLTDWSTACILRFWGIPFAPARLCRTPTEARAAAAELGYPVALKVVSPDIAHKTEVGGVTLDVQTPTQLGTAWRHLRAEVRRRTPAARIWGIMVQPMQPPGGVELILGGLRDPSFGPVVSVGVGGIFAGVYRDVAYRLAPVTPIESLEMLRELRAYPLLTGARGRPAVDLGAAAQVIVRTSQAIADLAEVRELDINPVLLYPDRVVAVDGLLRLQALPGSASSGARGHGVMP